MGARDDFSKALDRFPPDPDSLAGKEEREPRPGPPADKLPIQDRIDLHGMTLEQARRAVDGFLKQAAGRGLRKVLIIHGKGGGVLKTGVARYLEGHPLAGRRQPAKTADGGSGALVVLLRAQ